MRKRKQIIVFSHHVVYIGMKANHVRKRYRRDFFFPLYLDEHSWYYFSPNLILFGKKQNEVPKTNEAVRDFCFQPLPIYYFVI